MGSALDGLPTLRDVINAHDLRADKALGQNFLLDQNITDKIARHADHLASGLGDKTVFEIGPGPGGLTRSLLKAGAKKVIAVEFDPRAVDALSGLVDAAEGRLEVVQADAMTVDLKAMCDGPRMIVANLPYNIATPLLIGWLKQLRDDPQSYAAMVLMFQKEVAQRIVAQVNTKAYGRLSILSQWLCEVRKLFDLSPAAFTPAPKVTSSVAGFVPRMLGDDAPRIQDLEAITAAAFGQRRKMIRSSMRDYVEYFDDCGLKEDQRAETVRVDEFIKLAKLLS